MHRHACRVYGFEPISCVANYLHGWLQVVNASDVLFLFSGSRSIIDIIASNKDKLQEDQILVAVTKDGGIDEYQASMYSLCKMLVCLVSCAAIEDLYARLSDCFCIRATFS